MKAKIIRFFEKYWIEIAIWSVVGLEMAILVILLT